MTWILVILIVILILLIIMLVLKTSSGDISVKIDSLLRKRFLDFQSNINSEMNRTREEVTRSKDLISEHTIKTIDTIKDMGKTINKIIQQQEETQKLGQSLKDILQIPKLRGSYGEAVLEDMLDRVLPETVWEKQYEIDEGKRVDAVIKIKDIIIPIDAKFPRDNYARYLESTVEEEKLNFWKEHETAVKSQIKSIATKYIKPDKGTSDFALMFIPSEAVYYETIAEKNYLGKPSKIYEYAQANHVIPVSPNTFYAFLQVILTGIQNIEIIKNARKLQEGLISIQTTFNKFYMRYEDIGKQLEKASESYRKGDKHIGSFRKKLETTISLEEFRQKSNQLEDNEE